MSEITSVKVVDEGLAPLLDTDFIKEMVRQMRAIDAYGIYDKSTTEEILEEFVMTKEKKREIPVIGDPDEIVISRIKGYFNAIATLIEKECGLMAVPMMSLTHEGFGRAIISVGKLIVMDRTLRDVHRFGFSSLSKMKDEGDALLAVALEIIGDNSKVAGM